VPVERRAKARAGINKVKAKFCKRNLIEALRMKGASMEAIWPPEEVLIE
jgi:hypothetical protein